MPQVLTGYGLEGKVKFVVRDFSLEEGPTHALQGAKAADCANDQGKFWRVHDALIGNSDALDLPKLTLYAQDVGLDMACFDKCVDSGKYVSKIGATMVGGRKLAVDGTLPFLSGVTDATGQ
jgi:protein-disulfide isomerase